MRRKTITVHLVSLGLIFLLTVSLGLTPGLASAAPAQVREKVILDSDMVELFDDGTAMLMLANHPQIELLGVTVVTGNKWLEKGLA
ncbi:MAG: nucleoside hydrolase, partial [Sporomusaceae bacterium]|nr:nucleoside hydrolase [Sporomusaceae bacterium]